MDARDRAEFDRMYDEYEKVCYRKSKKEKDLLFDKLDSNNYVIFDFALEDRYHDKLNREIDNIKISKGDYLSTLKEYIEKYIQILEIYKI